MNKSPQWYQIITIMLTCLSMSVAASWFITQNATNHIHRELDHLNQHTYQINRRAEGLYKRLIDPAILEEVPPAPTESDWALDH